jgi:O-antigen/teichoic acid export membrane protein
MVPRALIKIREVSLLEALNQLGYLVLLCIFSFMFELTIKGVFIAYIISTGIVTLIFIFFFRYYYWGSSSPLGMGEVYEIGMTAAISSFMAFGLGQQIDILFMNFFRVEKGDIGFYYLVLSIVTMFAFLSTGMGALCQSSFSEQYTKRGKEGIIVTFPLIVKACVFLTLPFGIFGIMFAKDIIHSLYGVDYLGAVSLLQFYTVCWCIQILIGASFCTPLFYILRQKKTLLAFQLLIGGLNIILDVILIPLYGALGAIIATGVSAVLIGLVEVVYLWKKIGIGFPWLFEIKIMVMCASGVLSACWIEGVGFFYLLAKGVVFVIVFLLMAKWLKPLEESDQLMIQSINPVFGKVAKYF